MSATRRIERHGDLHVYQKAFAAAMEIFAATRTFPREERYSLSNQITKASRSVCANIAEAWRKRRYRAAFVAKLSDAESEACETQVWLRFSHECGYLDAEPYRRLTQTYDHIIGKLVRMATEPDDWLIKLD